MQQRQSNTNRKQKNNQSHRQKGKFIFPEQKILIENLQDKIKNYATEINRPYSTLASSFIFPMVLWYLLMDERSPLHFIYNHYYGEYFEERHKYSQQILGKIIDQSNTYNEFGNIIDDTLSNMQQLIEFVHHKKLTVEESLQYIDENPDNLFEVPHVNQLKVLLSKYIDVNMGINDPLRLSDVMLSKRTVLSLYKEVLQYKDIHQGMVGSIQTVTKYLSYRMIRMDFNKAILLPKVVFVMLGQLLIVNPILQRFFPYGIFQRNFSGVLLHAPSRTTTFNEAENLIVNLQATEKVLAPVAKRSIMVTRGLVILLLTLSIVLQGEAITPFLLCFMISAFSSAISGILDEMQKAYVAYQLNKQIAISKKSYRALLDEFLHCIIVHSGVTPQFECQFKPYQELSIKDVYNVVLSVFKKHRLNIKQNFNRRIFLNPISSLSINKIFLIQKDLNLAMARASEVKKLSQQLETLRLYQILEIFSVIDLEQEFLSILKIYLKLPSALVGIFKEVFSNLALNEEGAQDDSTYLFLEGFTPAEKQKMLILDKELTSYLNKQLNTHDRSHHFLSQAKKNKEKFKPQKKSVKASFNEENGTVSKKEEGKLLHVEWPSGTYDENHPGDIVPIKSTFCKAKRLFSLFKLEVNDFDGNQEAYKHFKKMITDSPHIVPPKGCRGLTTAGTVNMKNHRGLWFRPSLKAKSISTKFGNIRVFASKEVAETGEELHVFKAVNLKAH